MEMVLYYSSPLFMLFSPFTIKRVSILMHNTQTKYAHETHTHTHTRNGNNNNKNRRDEIKYERFKNQ